MTSSFFQHKGFILDFKAGFPNDIGLIQLSEPVDLAKHGLEPISLPEGHEDFSGAPCYITGWGKTKAGKAPSNREDTRIAFH